MNGFQVKVHMVQVKPKDLILFHEFLNGSASDSENLVVDTEELKSKFSELEENDEKNEFIKDVLETIDNEVNYVWFYL